MKTLRGRRTARVTNRGGLVVAFAVLALLALFLPTVVIGQGMPPRGYTLMRTKPIVKPPVAPVDRLRQEIIDATNPVSGTVNVRQLKRQTTTRPGQLEQNAVATQYNTQTSTRPPVEPTPNVSVTQSGTQASTRSWSPQSGSRQEPRSPRRIPMRLQPLPGGSGGVTQGTRQPSTR